MYFYFLKSFYQDGMEVPCGMKDPGLHETW